MYALLVHPDAEEDLEEIDVDAAAKLVALLEELESSQDSLDRLSQNRFKNEDIDVQRLSRQWNFSTTYNTLWRLKALDLERIGLKYRVIYAYVPSKRTYHVLAIAHRDFNYDPTHELSKRIFGAFQEL